MNFEARIKQLICDVGIPGGLFYLCVSADNFVITAPGGVAVCVTMTEMKEQRSAFTVMVNGSAFTVKRNASFDECTKAIVRVILPLVLSPIVLHYMSNPEKDAFRERCHNVLDFNCSL